MNSTYQGRAGGEVLLKKDTFDITNDFLVLGFGFVL